jgi:beta-phosphoglucomutase-like phosphatase (HAD superfamily)
MKKNIRAVFWDVDRTMVMSEGVHDEKMHHIAAIYNFSISSEVMNRFYGTGDHVAYEIMREQGFIGTKENFVQLCNNYYLTRLETIEIREGFLDAFLYFERIGLPQSAVSNGDKTLVKMNIERTGVRERLCAVIDLDYMHAQDLKGKPSADPYLEALRQVNEITGKDIKPSECLVIEDSPTGVKAGKAAEMHVILWKLSPQIFNSEADYEAETGEELIKIIKSLPVVAKAA